MSDAHNVGAQVSAAWTRHAVDTKDNFEFERQVALRRSDSMLDLRLKK
jgi:hypothetical protein